MKKGTTSVKEQNLFQAFSAIDQSYLDEAVNARPASKARILSILLPVAAMVALFAAATLIVVPLNVTSTDPVYTADTPAQPVIKEAPLSDMDLPTPEVGQDENGLIYEHYGDHVEIKGYLGRNEVVVVPEKIDGATITVFDLSGEPAITRVYYNGEGLAEMILPDDVKVIFCIGKDVVNINDGLLHSKNIKGFEVDADNPVYASYSGMLFTNDLRTLILCPAGCACRELYYEEDESLVNDESVAFLPSQLQTVGRDAFTSCRITGAVFPSTLTNVESGAFRNCTDLKALFLPASLRYLSSDAFDGCTAPEIHYEGTESDFDLLHVNLPQNVKVFCASDKTVEDAA